MMVIIRILLLCSIVFDAESLVHRLKIINDDRDIFKIETFGFKTGGMMNLTLTDFSIATSKADKLKTEKASTTTATAAAHRIGFIMRKASTESAAQQDLEKTIEKGKCILDNIQKDDFLVDLSDEKEWKLNKKSHVVLPGASGLYSLIFARCQPSGAHKVSPQVILD